VAAAAVVVVVVVVWWRRRRRRRRRVREEGGIRTGVIGAPAAVDLLPFCPSLHQRRGTFSITIIIITITMKMKVISMHCSLQLHSFTASFTA
jgi:hypothetical protein